MKSLDTSSLPPASARENIDPFSTVYSGAHRRPEQRVTIPTLKVDEPANQNDQTSYPDNLNLVSLYEKAKKSVVEIDGCRELKVGGLSPVRGRGSGFFANSNGDVVTALHVVQGVKDLSVTTWQGQRYPAHILSEDRAHDLALLKIDKPAKSIFSSLQLGYSDDLQKGAQLFAFGYPNNWHKLFYSPGTYVEAAELYVLQPEYEKILKNADATETMLRVSAHSEHGDSGEPVLDSNGQVVGITDIGCAKEDVLAIPVEQIKRLIYR
jgi:S1-C subfamily serine protease